MKKCPKCGREFEKANTLCPADGTVLVKSKDELVGQTLADKYRVEELINEGGMGAVYRGTHILMDKTVAIKVLHPALAADDKIVARFSREARAASRISHPHALNVTDFGESSNGVVFLVMEYLKGETLKEVIHTDGPMPLPRVIEIIRQVCGALEAAHGEGVVHRDLKSDNIMLVDVGSGSDWAKVLDFGIAKITEKVGQDPGLTAPNLIIGTPQYMSPEQCSQASEIDSRSDIYSLGVILYEMLVGHVPFTGESPTAIMMKHLQEPPPSVLEERQDLNASVGRVVTRAMAKRPEDRFQTVSELSEALALAAEGKESAVAAAATTATGPNAPDRSTNRIVVPTGSNKAPRGTSNEDRDEATVVQSRQAPANGDEPEIFTSVEAAPQESFNPWRIIVPAVAGLLVIFAVVFAITRNSSQPAANSNSAPLGVEPGSQPVQPAQPPTGRGEQNIAPSVPSSSPGESTPGGGETAPGRNANAAPAGNANAGNPNEAPRNQNAGNTGEPQPSPTRKKNTNQPGDTPEPQPSPAQDDGQADDEPPPAPTPKRQKQLPKPNIQVDPTPAPPSGNTDTPDS
ncbi:MAG TPA: protein kinase [Pyrinomonadaceae bacterium]|jgi:serine/threonine-protein kinase